MLWGKVTKTKKFHKASEFKKSKHYYKMLKRKLKDRGKELKPVDTAYFEDPDANLFIPGSAVAPTLTPQKVFSKKVKAPRSTKQR